MDENKDTIQNDNKSRAEEMLLEVERRVAEKRGTPSESEARAEEQLREIKRRVGEIKRTHNGRYDDGEKKDKRPAIIILSIAFTLFAACIGLFVWNIVKMRTYESDYVKMYGKVVDVEVSHSSGSKGHSSTTYYLVISYTYDGKEYTFTDNVGHSWASPDDVGKRAQIYVNPQHPDDALVVMSSGSTAIAYSCCFCFFCFAYAIGMMLLLGALGTSFLKRLCFVWGMIIVLGIALFLLPWIGFPNSSFGEVFSRMDGAVGIIVVCGLAFLAMCADGAIMYAVHRCERGY
ncbi:MAG: DUF3592 domain-containing protein [Clostridiales bacterium]|nr:DUF3592 domain-containing protein [Clostridiales bacterium]